MASLRRVAAAWTRVRAVVRRRLSQAALRRSTAASRPAQSGSAATAGQGLAYLAPALTGQGRQGLHHPRLPILAEAQVLGLQSLGDGLVQIGGYGVLRHG